MKLHGDISEVESLAIFLRGLPVAVEKMNLGFYQSAATFCSRVEQQAFRLSKGGAKAKIEFK